MTLSMENQRVLVWAALGLVLFLNYMAWQRDYPPVRTAPSPAAVTAPVSNDALPTLPSGSATAPAAATAAAPPPSSSAAAAAPVVRVVTDVLDMDISTRGGELTRADLRRYPKEKNRPNIPVRLFDSTGQRIFVARSGLRAPEGQSQPTHQVQFEAPQREYRLRDGERTLEIPLTWTDGRGLTVTKVYTFQPGSYRVDLSYRVHNESDTAWKGASYVQLVRHYEPVSRSMFNVETYAYRGPAIYDGKAYRKLEVEDDEDKQYTNQIAGGWLAALQHHFVAAAIPATAEPYQYQLSVNANNDFSLSYVGPLKTVAPGTTTEFREKLFVGPKLQEQLTEAGPELQRTADYGKLTIIAQPLFWLLEKTFEFVKNWGVSIIIVTFLLKLAFYRLTAAGYRSMAKMRAVAPRIKSIQERYKDDREQLGRSMMELYKREKINPLGGCLPMVVQIPVFLAFYWVLLESVEMRQAPFFAWITDLSSRDPYFILPLLMGAAMFVQFKLTPTPTTDPMQAKVFAFMPVVMTGMMAWFPAGLVLYWLTNTLLSIAQQWRINQVVAAGEAKAKA
jgi:YidC/Oxa1 family membrane protein insertase